MALIDDNALRERLARDVGRVVVPALGKQYESFVNDAITGAISECLDDARTLKTTYAHGNIKETNQTFSRIFRTIERNLKSSGACPLDRIDFAFSMLGRTNIKDDPGQVDRLFFQ